MASATPHTLYGRICEALRKEAKKAAQARAREVKANADAKRRSDLHNSKRR